VDFIVKALFGAAAAAVGTWIANEIVKEKTGKSIPQHLGAWWAGTRDKIAAWATRHGRTNILKVVCFVDRVVASTQKLFRVEGTTRTGSTEVIETRRLSLEEIQKQFPGMSVGASREITSIAL